MKHQPTSVLLIEDALKIKTTLIFGMSTSSSFFCIGAVSIDKELIQEGINPLEILPNPHCFIIFNHNILSECKCMNKQNTPMQRMTSISTQSPLEGEMVHFLYDGGKL
jgi:hypothetical protein